MTAATINEFWVTKPSDQARYTTLEFHNDIAGTRRFVTMQSSAKFFQLESDAPRNAGQVVTFDPIPFEAPEPEQGDEGEVSLDITLGGVGFEVKSYLKQCFSGWPPKVEVIWRRHLEGIAEPPVVFQFQSKDSSIQLVNAQIQCRQVNYGARGIGRTYKYDDFLGLRPSI